MHIRPQKRNIRVYTSCALMEIFTSLTKHTLILTCLYIVDLRINPNGNSEYFVYIRFSNGCSEKSYWFSTSDFRLSIQKSEIKYHKPWRRVGRAARKIRTGRTNSTPTSVSGMFAFESASIRFIRRRAGFRREHVITILWFTFERNELSRFIKIKKNK